MTQNAYGHASQVYQSSIETNMSGFEIAAELYKGMMKNIGLAKRAHEEGKLDVMCHWVEKTNKIVMALMAHINYEKGGEGALFLDQFYREVLADLLSVLRKDDVPAAFDEIHEKIKPVYEIWQKHAADQSVSG